MAPDGTARVRALERPVRTRCTPTSGTRGSRSAWISSSRTAWSRRRTAARSTPRARSSGRGSSARSATTSRTRPRPTAKAGRTSPASRTSRCEGQTYHHRYDAFLTPVRRRRRRAVDAAVRHERDRPGARDRGLGDRRVRRGFDGRALPQAEGTRWDRRVRGAVRSQRDAGLAAAVRDERDDEVAAIAATRGSVYLAGTSDGRSRSSSRTGRPTRSSMRLDPDGSRSLDTPVRRVRRGLGSRRLGAGGRWSTSRAPPRASGRRSGTWMASSPHSIRAAARRWAYQFGHEDEDSFTSIGARAERRLLRRVGPPGTFLFEEPSGGVDAVVGKLDLDGAIVWSHQFGSPADDEATVSRRSARGCTSPVRRWERCRKAPRSARATGSSASTCRTAPKSGRGSSAPRTTTRSTAWPRTPRAWCRRHHARSVRGPDERRRPGRLPREDRVLLTPLPRRGLARTAIWWKLAA